MSASKTLILGIGNTLLSDEGVGVHMLDYLRRHHPELSGAQFLDGGTLSFTLAPYIETAEHLVVVDAAELMAPPGTVQVFTGDEMDRFAGRTKRSVHEVSLGDLLCIAHLTDCIPAHRALVAIQPEFVDWGHALSNPVKRALPQAARRVLTLLHQWNVVGPVAITEIPLPASLPAG
ncbi:MAG TPA: HyaD/HybD family hydrogenase maturation endopeptidase [Gammaproteobacteria bacterium]|nr:HyaD/HybD family hydrogenase maturation endopeptidase [Gammaproteobacteria bacterium]